MSTVSFEEGSGLEKVGTNAFGGMKLTRKTLCFPVGTKVSEKEFAEPSWDGADDLS